MIFIHILLQFSKIVANLPPYRHETHEFANSRDIKERFRALNCSKYIGKASRLNTKKVFGIIEIQANIWEEKSSDKGSSYLATHRI